MWFIILSIACSTQETYTDEQGNPIGLVGLEIEPTEATLLTGPEYSESQEFTVWGIFEDGERLEATYVDWDVSNRSAGDVDDAGLFSPSESNGGTTWVTAEYANMSAQATVTVIYTEDVIEGGADPTIFADAQVDSMQEWPWLYPEDGVALPRNTPMTFFQWKDLKADAYRLRFESAVSDISVYMTDNGWESPEDLWQIIAGTNAGGQVQVYLAAAADGAVLEADPLTIEVNRMDARGSIYYWSSSVKGVKMIPYGATEPEDFLSIFQTEGYCIGCHAISTGDDHLLAFSYADYWQQSKDPDYPAEGYMEILHLEDIEDFVMTIDDKQVGNYKSFTPDGSLLLAVWDYELHLWNGRTGEYLANVTPYNPEQGIYHQLIQAEWSPDGTKIAIATYDEPPTDEAVLEGIAVLDYLGDYEFGEPEWIVIPKELFGSSKYLAYYPAWSPDGEWIAFNISTGDSYDDADAELYVIRPDGTDMTYLAAANMGTNLTNSWPRWGPLPDDEVLWLTFASRRDYGYTAVTGDPQIWVSAFDPSKIEQGEDPSSPAFWLPGQLSNQNNHVPLWIE